MVNTKPIDFFAVRLFMESALQLSVGSIDYTQIEENLHSDTIKSALFVCAKQIFGEEINNTFFHKFLISSALPSYKEEIFFPKPFIKIPCSNCNNQVSTSIIKKLKKLQWIEHSLFEKILRGESIEIDENYFSEDNKFLSKSYKKPKLYQYEELPRVKINIDDSSVPYYHSKIRFYPDTSFVILIKTEEEFFNRVLVSAFRLLQDNGIGSYRSLGNGYFRIKKYEKITLHVPDSTKYYTNLSLYCPEKKELDEYIDLSTSSYMLLKRGGYISHYHPEFQSYPRKSIYMFQEGSVFCTTSMLQGKFLNVAPSGFNEHEVWRDGRAIFIPIYIKPN